MHRTSGFFPRRFVRLACWACAATLFPLTLHGQLLHQYTFNDGNANDIVGGAHGTFVDNTGISFVSGGAINLSANNGAGSNQDFSDPGTVGAFVDLPNGVFTNAVTGGSLGQATLEIWFTVQENRPWAQVYTFGTSDGGEGSSTGGGGSDYVALIPQSGPGDFRATTKAAAGDPAETPIIGSPTPLPTNQKHHVVLTLDQFDSTAGVNGTAQLYLNNGAPATEEIRPFLDLMLDNNNWLGRSQWPDSLFDGTIDEFRIYGNTLSASDVANSFAAGPVPAPLPVLVVNRDTGQVTIENQTGGGIQLKGYSITSAAGSLVASNWSSIDAGGTFDPNGTWTTQSLTEFEISESVTGGVLDGGTLTALSSWSLGTPWLKTPFEDLQFSFTLGDDSVNFGNVEFTGNAAMRSDLDGDGGVDADDWELFVQHSFTSLTGDSAATAYLKGDLNGDMESSYRDFQIFKQDFITANGVAAFNALVGVVPEPSSIVMAQLACLWILGCRRKRIL